ncbi:carcinine transporter-like [Anticarsia gemmatalis]|uniref:carcinine transporter-like n=1 Tax=Anticarsia gemmatalis TaxID=129554 RepID=UPI003F775423
MGAVNGDKDVENILDKKKNIEKEVSYDEILTKAGEMGCYQWLLVFYSLPFYWFGVMVYFSQMFITEVSPNHWCRIPELENLTDFQRRDLGVPKDENSRFGYSQCQMYDVNWTEVLATGHTPDQTWNTVPCQYGWEFNKSEIPYPTIASDYGWVCDKNSYQATAQAIFFVGSIFGGLLFGWVSDRFGRLPGAMTSCLVGCIGGVTSTFARNLTEFSAARFVLGMSSDSCMIMPYLIMLEYVAPKYRTLISNVAFAVFYSFSATVLPWISLACGHWKTICLVTSLPLLVGVAAKLFLPESPMWLLSKGRVDETIDKILLVARMNKKKIPTEMIEQFRISATNAKKEQNQSFLEIFKRPSVRWVFILSCIEFMCCSTVFDGLIRIIGQLEFDFFVSFSLMSMTEFPSVLLVGLIMDYTGRKWLCIVCLCLCSFFTVVAIFTTGIQTVILAIVARFTINMAYSGTMQWVSEILPTSVRGGGVALVHIVGYIATFLSPYISYLKVFYLWLPLAVLGSIAAIGMSIAFMLPETAICGMPQSFEEAEELIRNQNLWTLPCLERKKEKKRKEGQINPSFELET